MEKEKSKIDKVMKSYCNFKNNILNKFCEKQNLTVFSIMADKQKEIVFFSPDLRMSFRDVFLDLLLRIEKGVAVRYMDGFDMDLENAEIDKLLSYKEYLESKKLI